MRDSVVVLDTDTVADRVKGRVVGIPERERVRETERVLVTDTVPDRVKGRVVGIPDRVTEIVGERVK